MTTTENTKEILNLAIGEKIAIEDYPYGFTLRTTMFMWVEFKKGKGYRIVSQTINPKNGQLNKPKSGVYLHYAWLEKNSENGHIVGNGFNFYGLESIEKFSEIITANEIKEFTAVESSEFWAWVITCLRGEIGYSKIKSGYTLEDVKAACKVADFMAAFKDKKDILAIKDINFSAQEVKALLEK